MGQELSPNRTHLLQYTAWLDQEPGVCVVTLCWGLTSRNTTLHLVPPRRPLQPGHLLAVVELLQSPVLFWDPVSHWKWSRERKHVASGIEGGCPGTSGVTINCVKYDKE